MIKMKRFFTVSCVYDRNHPSVWRRVWFSLKLSSVSNQRMEQIKQTLHQKTPAVTIPLLRFRVCAALQLQYTPAPFPKAITVYVLMSSNIHTLFIAMYQGITFSVSVFCSLALKNSADRKFSYLQLPVSLKLLYTILQVHVSHGSFGLVWRSCVS